MARFRKSVFPAVGTVLAVGVQWVSTGVFDKAELATALTGLGAALVSYFVVNE
jgi:hypothetical protein